MRTMRPFSFTCATVSIPLPVRSRYATLVGLRIRNVSSPLGDTLTCPSAAKGADATKNRCCACKNCASLSSMDEQTRPTLYLFINGFLGVPRQFTKAPRLTVLFACRCPRRLLLPRDLPGIDGFAHARHRLIGKLIPVDFDQHEGAIFVEARCHDVATVKIVAHQLS